MIKIKEYYAVMDKKGNIYINNGQLLIGEHNYDADEMKQGLISGVKDSRDPRELLKEDEIAVEKIIILIEI